MQNLTPKSSELLRAQVAAFAAEHVENYYSKEHLFNNVGSLALGGIEDVTRITTSPEYQKDENDKMMRIPEGTVRLVATGKEYVDFIRSIGGSRAEAIQGRADILGAYGVFAPVVNKLREEVADPATRKEHSAYLGSGTNATVFEVQVAGKKYAVRIPKGSSVKPGMIDSHLAGAVLSKGISHMEQIVAASYEDGVTVAEIMPGKEVGQLAVDEIEAITDGQLSEIADTLVTARARGIEIDPKPSNFFYDPEAGYGIVDYHSSKVASKVSRDQDLGEVVGWFATVIDNTGFFGKEYKFEKVPEDYAHDLELHKANLDVLNRYRTVVEHKLTGEEQTKALKEIDTRMHSSQEIVKNYSDANWVAKQIAQDKERARRRAEHVDNMHAGKTKIELDFV